MIAGLVTCREAEPWMVSKLPPVEPLQVETGGLMEFLGDFCGPMQVVPFWYIPTEGGSRRLKRPLGVRIRKDGDFCFVENDTLRLMGTGTTREEALADFFTHLLHFHRYYANMPLDKLMGEAVVLKKLFQNMFAGEH